MKMQMQAKAGETSKQIEDRAKPYGSPANDRVAVIWHDSALSMLSLSKPGHTVTIGPSWMRLN